MIIQAGTIIRIDSSEIRRPAVPPGLKLVNVEAGDQVAALADPRCRVPRLGGDLPLQYAASSLISVA